MTTANETQRKTLASRLLTWALIAFAIVVVLVAVAVLNNNYSLHQRSKAEFSSQLDRAIETSTQWMVQHPEIQGNPPLMFMIGDMADMSGDPRLRSYVENYVNGRRVRLPGNAVSWYWARMADGTSPVPLISRQAMEHIDWQDRWFSYGAAPNRMEMSAEDHADLFSPTKYSWGIRLHLQLIALDIYRRFNGPSPELNAVINPVAEGVARDAYWDFRVNDSYFQRNGCILGAGRPDLIRSRWIDRILDYQQPDGTWKFCWHGWCRGVFEFRSGDVDLGHSTVQAAWTLYQLKYRYSDWIGKNYQ